MLNNFNTTFSRQPEFDIAVSKALMAYETLNNRQQIIYQQALLNQPVLTPNLDQHDPSTWLDLDGKIGPISWDWPGWLAKGFLTILASEAGQGKSALLLRIASCYTLGEMWPDGTTFSDNTGSILWCEAEAAQALNLERARKWGLPLDKILAPLPDPLLDINLELSDHRSAILDIAAREEVKLIIVDSLRGSHRGDEDASSMFDVVVWFAEMARDLDKPVMLTHHLRKRSIIDAEGVTLDRLRGSSAITQPSRIVWALDIPDVKSKDVKRLSVIKSNLGRFPTPVGIMITEDGVICCDPPETPKTETQLDRAVELLLSLLMDEPMLQEEVEDAAKAHGISMTTINKAKKTLGILSAKQTVPNGKWLWSLPVKDAME